MFDKKAKDLFVEKGSQYPLPNTQYQQTWMHTS